jgi:hypothetical protein
MTVATTAAAPGAEHPDLEPGRFLAALERTLELAAEDERIGPLICACRPRLRFLFDDLDTALDLSAWAGRLRWSFAPRPDWEPRLVIELDSAVANRYLLGRESLAIAIARGQVRVRGDSRAALLYLPATQLLGETYREVVAADFPELGI